MLLHHFPDITLLVTHYNRSSSLENLLQSFEQQNISFASIIISDDGSQPIHFNKLESLKERYELTLVPAAMNGGLGRNLNKGRGPLQLLTPYMFRKILKQLIFC